MGTYILNTYKEKQLSHPIAFQFDPFKKHQEITEPDGFFEYLGEIPSLALTFDKSPQPLMERTIGSYCGFAGDMRDVTKVDKRVILGDENERDLYPLARIWDGITAECFDVYEYGLCVFYNADDEIIFITRLD